MNARFSDKKVPCNQGKVNGFLTRKTKLEDKQYRMALSWYAGRYAAEVDQLLAPMLCLE